MSEIRNIPLLNGIMADDIIKMYTRYQYKLSEAEFVLMVTKQLKVFGIATNR